MMCARTRSLGPDYQVSFSDWHFEGRISVTSFVKEHLLSLHFISFAHALLFRDVIMSRVLGIFFARRIRIVSVNNYWEGSVKKEW